MSKSKIEISRREFICLMALLMSLVALSIDALLPALAQIGSSIGVYNSNSNQLILSTIFLGIAVGVMFYGPYSDAYGRKKAIYLGISIFVLGSLFSLFSTNFTVMLIGRVCQGFGIASCRVVALAMIRDRCEGNEMARVMSLIMIVFIVVPTLAPSVGQIILQVASWRAIFGFILSLSLISLLWLYFRQVETLAKEKRRPFSIAVVISGIKETWNNRQSRTYTIASGIIFGAFIGYLCSAQQVLQIQYELGNLFSIYFGGLALAIGLSSFINAKLVMKFSMEILCIVSLLVHSMTSFLFFIYIQHLSSHPDLFTLLSYLAITFFCFGILFGNFNAIALQSLGHIAGVATSVISSMQTLISVMIGGAIGQSYDGTIQPLVFGFLLCGISTLLIIFYHKINVKQVSI